MNGPAVKKGLSERHEDLAVAFAKDLEGPLPTAGGRYAAKPGLKVAARVIPMRSMRAKLVRSTMEKLVREARPYLRSRIQIGADDGFDPNSTVGQPLPEDFSHAATK